MIEISEAKAIRESLNVTHLVLFAVDANGAQHVATHGLTEKNATEAAEAGNNLKAALGWEAALCSSKPVQRICKNCTYYEPDFGTYCVNGWSKFGDTGHCMCAPEKVKVEDSRKCALFEPKI
jgi:hypothetical protein